MSEKEETIYTLDLHESLMFEGDIEVFRVPGGWIYSSPSMSSVFVPYNDEYLERKSI